MLTREELLANPLAPVLDVSVTVVGLRLSDRDVGLAFSLILQLRQRVYLVKNLGQFDGATWMSDVVGIRPYPDARKILTESFVDQVQKFINDYLSVNPPTPKSEEKKNETKP